MTNAKSRLLLLAVGLLTAGPASAATLTVYAKMSGSNAVGIVTTAAGSDASAAINCATNSPTGCVDTAVSGTVILEPGTGTNAVFVSWVGCNSVVGQQCTLNLATNKTVTANFAPASQSLTVKTYPTGVTTFGGKLTAATTPAIDCRTGSTTSTACQTTAAHGSSVVLSAIVDANSKVTSWSGCASTTLATATAPATCTVTMNAAKSVSATFGADGIVISGSVSGPGSIRISEGSAVKDGMFCPGDCSAVASGTGNVTVTAIPDAGAKFSGWAGLCTGTGSCSITVAQLNNGALNKVVSAGFKGASGGACGACHSQPLSHLPYDVNCGSCHFGYTDQTANSSTHMDGNVDLAPLACDQPPATFGVAFEIVGGGIIQNAGDANDRAYVDVKVLFDGETVGTNIPASFSPTQWGSSGAPRFAFGEILADGSFDSVLVNATGTKVTSESSSATTTSRFTLQDAGTGTYRYTFSTSALAKEGLDLTKTYRAVVYGARYFTPPPNPPLTCATTQFPTSDYFDFSPTGTLAAAKSTVTDAKCNACHGAVNLHGRRRGVAICLTCHNPSTPLGTNNTVAFKWDLKNVAHKIHSGMNYDGINPMTGVQGSSWGTTMDASHMAQGPSHTLYFEGAGSTTTPATTADDNVHQLPTQIQCSLCHDETKTDHLVASQAGCSSCHEINWVTGAGHGASYPTVLAGETGHPHTDAECAECHPATGPVVHQYAPVLDLKYPVATVHSGLWEPATGVDFARDFTFQGTSDSSARTVTAVPTVDGVQRHKPEVNVVGFTVDSGTGRATITFDVLLDGSPYTEFVEARAAGYTTSAESKGAAWPTCAFTLAGPAESDYVVPPTGSNNLSCAAATAVAGTPGRYTMSPTTVLSSYADGTYTLSYEMMYSRQGGTPTTGLVRKPFAVKPNFYTVTKTGTAWTFGDGSPRRAVVAFDKCNNCHIQIGFHSNQSRQGPDYCAMCHNPMLDNGGRDRVKFADARDPAEYGALVAGVPAGQKTYLVESVSMNIFIHRIHMGSDLPSVANPNQASPWVPEPGRIFYGATRAATVGSPNGSPPSITDLSQFAMPNPMGRCNQCHLDGTWATPETARAPIKRTFKVCAPISYLGEDWCNPVATSGPATVGTLWTPPIKAVCTSCHDDVATDAHADQNTVNPMSQTAVEACVDCHGASTPWDAMKVHPAIP